MPQAVNPPVMYYKGTPYGLGGVTMVDKHSVMTMLYSRETGDSEDVITLSENFDHFDLLVISGRAYINDGLWHQSNAYICDSLAVGNRVAIGDDGSISWFDISNKTTLVRAHNAGNLYQITHVMGVKFNGMTAGGSGSNIYYGYSAPIDSGNDGDLYIVLNNNHSKVAEFLYIEDEWMQIDGSELTYSVAYYRTGHSSDTDSVYTATEECDVLVFNQNLNGEASNKTMTAGIATTGALKYEDTYSTNWNNPDRNQITHVAIIHLTVGDTVTLSNTHEGGYTTQFHLVLELSILSATGLTRSTFESKADNTFGTPVDYVLPSDGVYFAIGFQCRGTGQGTQNATISALDTQKADIKSVVHLDNNVSATVALIRTSNKLTFNWGSLNDYATKGYAVYKLK